MRMPAGSSGCASASVPTPERRPKPRNRLATSVIAVERRIAGLGRLSRFVLAAATGAAMALAQSPVSWPWVMFLALPVLFWLLDGARGWRAGFAIGWTAGAGF